MRDKIKILYFMNVDWSWIRQRPHILAQMLDEIYDVTVLYPKYITRPWRKQYRTKETKRCKPIFQIPFEQNSLILSKLQERITVNKIGDVNQYDIVWCSSPVYQKYIPDDYRGMIIYDDMDDNVALQTDKNIAERMRIGQDALFERADIVLTTSNYLMSRLSEKMQEKAYLVRNGSCVDLLEKVKGANSNKERFDIGYLGTISEWFDFSLIQKCVNDNSDIRFNLFGPNLVSVPRDEQIILHGIIEHDEIVEKLDDMDCMIMPFVLNEIVLAVDPVKLYEYIGMGKCIISIKYPEIERFEDFVYFYEDESSLQELLKDLKMKGFPPKYNEKMQKTFLADNSWEQRIKEIDRVIMLHWRNR